MYVFVLLCVYFCALHIPKHHDWGLFEEVVHDRRLCKRFPPLLEGLDEDLCEHLGAHLLGWELEGKLDERREDLRRKLLVDGGDQRQDGLEDVLVEHGVRADEVEERRHCCEGPLLPLHREVLCEDQDAACCLEHKQWVWVVQPLYKVLLNNTNDFTL